MVQQLAWLNAQLLSLFDLRVTVVDITIARGCRKQQQWGRLRTAYIQHNKKELRGMCRRCNFKKLHDYRLRGVHIRDSA